MGMSWKKEKNVVSKLAGKRIRRVICFWGRWDWDSHIVLVGECVLSLDLTLELGNCTDCSIVTEGYHSKPAMGNMRQRVLYPIRVGGWYRF